MRRTTWRSAAHELRTSDVHAVAVASSGSKVEGCGRYEGGNADVKGKRWDRSGAEAVRHDTAGLLCDEGEVVGVLKISEGIVDGSNSL
jgi:hypothetical protein